MSHPAIRSALEQRLATLPGGWPIVWENWPFDRERNPVSHLVPTLLSAEPDEFTIAPSPHAVENGVLQVLVYVKENTGPVVADVKAQQIRDHFPSKSSYMAGGIVVRIAKRATIGPPLPKDGPWRPIPVSIPYWAYTA
jgi:hypothetical protein